jgi:hypothetical protein
VLKEGKEPFLLTEQASNTKKRVNDENLLERFFVFSHRKLRKKQKLFLILI